MNTTLSDAAQAAGWAEDGCMLIHRTTVMSVDPARAAYVEAAGCDQRQRSRSPLESGWYDMSVYRPLVEGFLARLGPGRTLVDLGCGPGRFLELLAAGAPRRLYALDFNRDDLLRAVAGLGGVVIPVHASLTSPPPIVGVADGAIAMESLCCLEEPGQGYRALRSWLRPGGLALVSNIAVGANFVHALLNRDWRAVRQVCESASYPHVLAGRAVPMALFEAGRGRREAEATGFRVVEQWTIPAGAALVIHALKAAGEIDDDSTALIEAAWRGVSDIPRLYVDLLEAV